MFEYDRHSTKIRAIATFVFGLAFGLFAPRAMRLVTEDPAQIVRVAGKDEPPPERSHAASPRATALDRGPTPSLAAAPPPLLQTLPNGPASTATRNDQNLKRGGDQRTSARDVAERALGFTAFIRRGPLYGAGILLDSAGHVLTCRHVIEGDERVTVSFHDAGPLPAEVVETDDKLDLALLHIDSHRATAAQVAPIFTVSTGDDVFGMGAPHKLRFSMSRGLVSYVGRPFDELYYLQTDLPTNSGNSGGPVMNDRGEVVGITTFIFRDSQGLAFALPIDYAFDRFKHLLGSSALDGTRFSAWRETAKDRARGGG